MSGDKCVYFNYNLTRRTSKNSFHPFPANIKMHEKWIINSGNINLDGMSPKKLRKRYICSDHFDKSITKKYSLDSNESSDTFDIKFPLSYFFTGTSIKGDNFVTIIKDCKNEILELSLVPTCIICDQGSQNRRMYTLLRGNEDQPSTTICGQKIFLIYDMPHLIKSVRNNLLNGNFVMNKNKLVSLNDIKMAYEIDVNNSARALIKITPTHLHPNQFQKMNCKLAIQLLSNSVSATIKTCVATGELKSSTAINTANFIEIINKMFDSANSKHLYDPNPNRRPMSNRNLDFFENCWKMLTFYLYNAPRIFTFTSKTTPIV
ncbi:Transposable element P transposase [Aphis craccivora]|uniref:Transposable element P transposase n=1 Tax=Aphis craccivora TaxID=307492 RepID=A0A6G0VUU2_APHCR|nr:Transposable element P transposase [Aphis craccivora]